MSDPLKLPKAELDAAEKAIVQMKASTSMGEFEIHWKHFLSCLEKTFKKIERTCQPQANIFQPWQGSYQRLRKKDMLLRYLKQARDADTHSIQEITQVKPGRTQMHSVGQSVHIRHMSTNDDGTINYDGTPMVVSHTPATPIAVPVKNNGEWYNPPTTHLGITVPSHNPVTLAELGLSFYKNYLNSVEKKFFPPTGQQPAS
ncbi:hypothetical protein WHX55_10985 [Pseudomonas fluorescens]|uniref:hypothetical protein n=1 Tax=Pseudomonas fluorescens TaxID=294 RepID=UPI003246CCFB